MLKQKSILEVKREEKTYQFFCENDSPLGEVHDALTQMLVFVINKMAEAHKKPEAIVIEGQ